MKTYKEADKILAKISQAKNILLVLHRDPDEDSVGSNVALAQALEKMDKTNVELISSDKVPEHLLFLPHIDRVKKEDIAKKDLSGFDLFIALDASSPHMLTRDTAAPRFPDNTTIVVIDHHLTNTKYGQINLVDNLVSSVGELLLGLLTQWNVKLDQDISTCLLTAMAGDTGTFRWATTKDTLEAASMLVKEGADFAKINFNLYQKIPIESFHFAAKAFEKLRLEKAGKYTFVWSAVPLGKNGKEIDAKSSPFSVVDFLKSIEGVDFAILITEEEPGLAAGSLRSRTDFDVSRIATALDGGGHKAAAGFTIREDFEKGVTRILETVRSVAEENS